MCGGCALARHIEARELGTLTTLPTMSFATSPSWTCVRATPNASDSARVPAPAPRAPSGGARDRKRGPGGHRLPVVARAHRNSARSRRSKRRDDDLITPQGRYPTAWATDLATIFGWDDVLEASGVSTTSSPDFSDPTPAADASTASGASSEDPNSSRVLLPKRIALDGANIAWSLGTSIRSRFKCRQFPLSAGIVRALDHEPWLRQGFDVVAFVPKEYVVGSLQTLADGGGRATLNAEKVKYIGKGVWVNQELMDLVDAGRVITVSRGAGTKGAKSDDLTIIEYAKETGSWICSNDQFRDHRRDRSLGFSGARDLKAFARMRRFEHSFRVAPGLDDRVIDAMRASSGWEPRVGWELATAVDGSPVPPPRLRGLGSRGKGWGKRRDATRREEEEEMMNAVMDVALGVGGGAETESGDAGDAKGSATDSGDARTGKSALIGDTEEFYEGPRTRNDNPDALGGVPPYYAYPQDVLPVFFEATPTAAMIAARKSFLNRQGWSVQTITGK